MGLLIQQRGLLIQQRGLLIQQRGLLIQARNRGERDNGEEKEENANSDISFSDIIELDPHRSTDVLKMLVSRKARFVISIDMCSKLYCEAILLFGAAVINVHDSHTNAPDILKVDREFEHLKKVHPMLELGGSRKRKSLTASTEGISGVSGSGRENQDSGVIDF
ncbi:hypothetical protein K469DRAFT_752164 [Zopfia rhizophila CBS 207.26]|uniref:Uncharacterized protein n=1 Tax=Zopfia rhizophila CBS 207.26 TaxID=1314779 RepID=A0A6A6DTH8_9PEZI|nr:hypothetical protein K469DRAFT_752164 [Zopfia rhizophila CBS 207.26]